MIVTHFQLLSGNFWKNDFIVFLFKCKFNISLYSFNISIYSLLVYSQKTFLCDLYCQTSKVYHPDIDNDISIYTVFIIDQK